MGCEYCDSVKRLSGDGDALCGHCVSSMEYLAEQNEARLESLWAWVKEHEHGRS